MARTITVPSTFAQVVLPRHLDSMNVMATAAATANPVCLLGKLATSC